MEIGIDVEEWKVEELDVSALLQADQGKGSLYLSV